MLLVRKLNFFAIRCGINQACSIGNISKIVVVTNSIHAAKKIFDYGSHPFQIHSAAILSELRSFFSSNNSNSIEFWECLSKLRWRFHHDINKDSKAFSVTPSYPTKLSWDFCKKSELHKLNKLWKMNFPSVGREGQPFLELLDNDLNTIKPSYVRGGPWLQAFGQSNSLCARATEQLPTMLPLERFNGYWNPRRDTLKHFIMFLTANPNAFAFNDN